MVNLWDTYSLQSVGKLSPPVAAFCCCLLISLSANFSLFFFLIGDLNTTQEKVKTPAKHCNTEVTTYYIYKLKYMVI